MQIGETSGSQILVMVATSAIVLCGFIASLYLRRRSR